MGRGGSNSQNHHGKGNNKSKGRMSYLRRVRQGGGAPESKVDEFGQKYGDYVPAYGSKPSWRNAGRGGGGRGKPREILRAGMVGFLCTTNNYKEAECTREAYNILNEYCEKSADAEIKSEVLDTETSEPSNVSGKDASSSNEVMEVNTEKPVDATGGSTATQSNPENDTKEKEEDIDDALSSELKNLRSEKWKFQRVDTGVKNLIMISTTIDDPTELAYRIFEDVTLKRQTKSRHLLRLLPIELTCNAHNVEEVKSKAKEIIEKHMKTGYISFKIIANVRLNGKLSKDELINSLADVVSKVNPLSFVDLTNSQYTIVAEVLKTTLCLGIVKDFVKFKKYNLLEAGTEKSVEGSEAAKVGRSETAKAEGSETAKVEGSETAKVEVVAPIPSATEQAELVKEDAGTDNEGAMDE